MTDNTGTNRTLCDGELVRQAKSPEALLPRVHWVEFEEVPWVPQIVREGVIEALGFLMRSMRVYDLAFPRFVRWAEDQSLVLDLGSGSGMHMDDLARWARNHAHQSVPRIILSDLQPNRAKFCEVERRHPDLVTYEPESVDATKLPPRLAAMPRSMLAAFHHLRPKEARELLADAARNGAGLFIFEPVARNPWNILSNAMGLFFGVLAPFFARRLSLWKIFLSTLVPIIPLLLSFDGVVSALRAYTVHEVEEMIASLPPNDLHWEVFEVRGTGMLSLFTGMCIVATPGRKVVHRLGHAHATRTEPGCSCLPKVRAKNDDSIRHHTT